MELMWRKTQYIYLFPLAHCLGQFIRNNSNHARSVDHRDVLVILVSAYPHRDVLVILVSAYSYRDVLVILSRCTYCNIENVFTNMYWLYY